jgi:hypothetical protein
MILAIITGAPARTGIAGYDFEASGKSIVERAVQEIIAETKLHSLCSE